MGYKVIFIENEVHMKVKLNNLVVIKEGNDIVIPLEDISMVVLDNLKIELTSRLLVQFAEKNIGLVISNHEHLPLGYFSSYDNYSRVSKAILLQIELGNDYYDMFWQKIIVEKIKNQMRTLQLLEKETSTINNIKKFILEVKIGDSTNREAHAAKIYFNELMGTTCSRGNEDILLNSGLDYGYTIIRSFIARLCVGYGLNTQLGIHHKNEYNRFNLVDDIIEPVRPIVDLFVYRLLLGEEYFKPEHRKKIINILNHFIEYNGKRMFVANMLEEYIMSYSRCFKDKNFDIEFPNVKKYEEQVYEV